MIRSRRVLSTRGLWLGFVLCVVAEIGGWVISDVSQTTLTSCHLTGGCGTVDARVLAGGTILFAGCAGMVWIFVLGALRLVGRAKNRRTHLEIE